MGLFGKSSTVYIPGCITFFKYREFYDLYQRIFNKLGIKFRILEKQRCCGLAALEAGYDAEARKLARENMDMLKQEDIKSIITTSPDCYKMLLQDYPKFLPDWNIQVKNIWQLIENRLEGKPRLIKFRAMELVTFHDNCYLGRHTENYEAPRKILGLIGYQIKELPDNREGAVCCGSCGGLTRTNPELASKIARERILQAKRLKMRKMIVTSLDNYQLLKRNAYGDVEILELAEVLALALGIKKKEREEPEEEAIEDEQKILDKDESRRLEEDLQEQIGI